MRINGIIWGLGSTLLGFSVYMLTANLLASYLAGMGVLFLGAAVHFGSKE